MTDITNRTISTSIGNVALGDRIADVLFREPDFVQEIDYEALIKKHGGVATVPAGTGRGSFDPDAWLASQRATNVRLPNGTIVRGVPEGTTQLQIRETLRASGYDVSQLEVGTDKVERSVSKSSVGAPGREIERVETIFKSKSTSREILIEGQRVTRIGYSCKDRPDYTSVGGTPCFASGEAVLGRFKSEVRASLEFRVGAGVADLASGRGQGRAQPGAANP